MYEPKLEDAPKYVTPGIRRAEELNPMEAALSDSNSDVFESRTDQSIHKIDASTVNLASQTSKQS